jgi:predicted PhzF superfamily epimerase YddE/YHI9
MQLDLIDVFGNGPLSGNPLAVVHGGERLDAAAMLALTRWLGFSETTFLLPPTEPGADYRVRIFYPAGELPFAGHPTLGTCHAWLEAGGVPRRAGEIVQQCGAGLVSVRQEAGRLAFRAPPLRRGGLLNEIERAESMRIAGVPAGEVIAALHADNGPGWQLLHLRSAVAVLAAMPEPRAPAGSDIGLIGAHPPGGVVQWEVRAFFTDPAGRLVEDPVTGSLNAAAAQYLFSAGLATGSYRAGQGRLVGADGLVHASEDPDGDVWIGGDVRTVASGAALPEF